MPANYKEKANGLVQLVEQRTREASGWKLIAERRMEALTAMAESLRQLEEGMVRSPLSRFVSSPLVPVLEPMTATTISASSESVGDFADQLTHVLKDVIGTLTQTYQDIEGGLLWGVEDLSVPADLYDDSGEAGGLSREEMGAFDRDTEMRMPSPSLPPPPTPPRSVSPVGVDTSDGKSIKEEKKHKKTSSADKKGSSSDKRRK